MASRITFVRFVPENEVVSHWIRLYEKGKHEGYEKADPRIVSGKSDTWVEVLIPHALYNADWNADEEAEKSMYEHKRERSVKYAKKKGKLPPGIAYFSGRTTRAYVSDGNHRAYAAYLRGEKKARFYMPLPQYEKFIGLHDG